MAAAPIALEYGIYRDGDNNLDEIQSACLRQASNLSVRDPSIAFVVEDTTARRGLRPKGTLRTERYALRDGVARDVAVEPPRDMSARATLAGFVASTLDRAQADRAAQTWIELVDHGAGDGGGLESASRGTLMNETDIAGAIADGVARHAAEHPEDATRGVDGVVANQCLMATLGFADALSDAGVRYLAASPEIMLAPGVPTAVASAIAHDADPRRMARDVVAATMNARYVSGDEAFGPAAAFSVLDTAAEKTSAVRTAVRTLNDDLTSAIGDDPSLAPHVRGDERAVRGMARCETASMPWKADRPAIGLYDKLANDARLPANVRTDARRAAESVRAMVLAHGESAAFEPYGGRDYSDAVGPTVHAPIREKQIDPWAPQVSETANPFWNAIDGDRLARALA